MICDWLISMKASTVLKRGLERLGRDGGNWVGHPPVKPGEYCSLTAIANITPTWSELRARSFLELVIGWRELSRWNDEKGRTWAQVKNAFRKAIRKAIAEGE